MKDHFDLIDVITGYQGAAVVTAAWRLGVFPELSASPRTSHELAERLEVDERSLDALLGALVVLGLASREGGGYVAGGLNERLGRDAELGLVIEKEAVFAEAWLRLDEVVRRGEPVLAPWADRVRTEPKRARAFLEALDVLARLTGPDLSALPELDTEGWVLDVGGGLGSYTRALVEAGRRVVLVELPTVARWTSDALDDLPDDRCRVVAGDVLREGIPAAARGAGCALVSHVLHDLGPSACVQLLRAVHEAVEPGGTVVVNDFARDVEAGAFGPLFDLMMRVETGGSAYSVDELLEMLGRAGFSSARRLEASPPVTLVAATA